MNELKFLEYSQDIDINSIFERKIELGAVIQFNLLQRVLEEFIKRQKSMNDKIALLESKIKIISNNNPGEDKDLELLLKKTEDDFEVKFNDNYIKNEEIKVNKKDINKNIDKENNIEDKSKENKPENIHKENIDNENIDNENKYNENKDNKNKEESNIEIITINNNDPDIKNRVDKLELIWKEMANLIKKINNDLNNYKNQSSHANKFHENKINELFKKINYITDFEMIKIDNRPIEEKADISKDMVNSIEQNLSQRIGNIEFRIKINDDSIYSFKKDIVTIKNLNDNLSKLVHSNQENIANISKDLASKTDLLNKKIEDEINKIKENCDKNYKENIYEMIKYNNELNDKINNLINDIKKINLLKILIQLL